MDTECSADRVGFKPLSGRKVTAKFDGGNITSDAGIVLLRELEEKIGIVERMAECFEDHRNPAYIDHTVEELLRQRIFGLVCGYEDLNDHDDWQRDWAAAVACGKSEPDGQDTDEETSQPLASSSTLNRLEWGPEKADTDSHYHKIDVDLARLQHLLVELFVELRDEPPDELVIDLDATDVAVHGDQEDKFYHGYYGHYCYLPLYVFCGEWLLGSLVRFAGQDASAGTVDVLHHLVSVIASEWPETRLIIRADSDFSRNGIFEFCEEWDLDYVIGIAKNPRLKDRISELSDRVADAYSEDNGPIRRYTDFQYETIDSWSNKRRIVAKAEYSNGQTNPRFVVTSLDADEAGPKVVYEEMYCPRGESENRIKESQLDLFGHRLSSRSRDVNQLRCYLSAAAYLLGVSMRKFALKNTDLADAQTATIRSKLLKLGAQIRVSTRRVWLHLASSYPNKALFRRVARRIRAGPTE